ncbi:hypothetical protein ACTNEY_16185, partial [Fusicatenibacter saccharivorans]|uniref:hypothetical protein n=1 Tax=Fusicatenibacter saccharivorans TaxID=1150298 RepID=UPI003F8CA136
KSHVNYSELLQLAKGWGNFISDRITIWRLPNWKGILVRSFSLSVSYLYGLLPLENGIKADIKKLIAGETGKLRTVLGFTVSVLFSGVSYDCPNGHF